MTEINNFRAALERVVKAHKRAIILEAEIKERSAELGNQQIEYRRAKATLFEIMKRMDVKFEIPHEDELLRLFMQLLDS